MGIVQEAKEDALALLSRETALELDLKVPLRAITVGDLLPSPRSFAQLGNLYQSLVRTVPGPSCRGPRPLTERFPSFFRLGPPQVWFTERLKLLKGSPAAGSSTDGTGFLGPMVSRLESWTVRWHPVGWELRGRSRRSVADGGGTRAHPGRNLGRASAPAHSGHGSVSTSLSDLGLGRGKSSSTRSRDRRFDALVETYKQLSDTVLFTLRLEVRLRAMHFVELAISNVRPRPSLEARSLSRFLRSPLRLRRATTVSTRARSTSTSTCSSSSPI